MIPFIMSMLHLNGISSASGIKVTLLLPPKGTMTEMFLLGTTNSRAQAAVLSACRFIVRGIPFCASTTFGLYALAVMVISIVCLPSATVVFPSVGVLSCCKYGGNLVSVGCGAVFSSRLKGSAMLARSKMTLTIIQPYIILFDGGFGFPSQQPLCIT